MNSLEVVVEEVVQQECVVILVPHLCVDSPAEVCMVSDSCLTRKAK